VLFVNEWTVIVNNPSDPESEAGRKEKMMNVDGEIMHLKKPEYTVKWVHVTTYNIIVV